LENRVLRKIILPKRDAVTCEWRRLHNEELFDLHSSQIIKRKRIRYVRHVALVEERKVNTGSRWGDVIEIDHLEYLGVSGCIILIDMFTECDIWSCT
jgi:hypothetical protein